MENINQEQIKKIKENNDKNTDILLSTSFIFEDNIDRIWAFLRDLSFSTVTSQIVNQFKYIKGNNTWVVGNECSFYWIGVSKMLCRCINIKDYRMKKIVVWDMFSDIGVKYRKSYYLYRISDCDKTMVKLLLTKIPDNQNEHILITSSMSHYINLQKSLLQKFAELIIKSKKNLVSYGSCVVKREFDITWKIMADVKKVSSVVPIIGTNFECKEPALQIGSFWKFFNKRINKFIFMKVIEVNLANKRNSWSYALDTIGADKKITQKLVKITVIKIGKNESQISILHTFKQNVSREYLKLFEINKREVLKQLKKFIENYEINDKEKSFGNSGNNGNKSFNIKDTAKINVINNKNNNNNDNFYEDKEAYKNNLNDKNKNKINFSNDSIGKKSTTNSKDYNNDSQQID